MKQQNRKPAHSLARECVLSLARECVLSLARGWALSRALACVKSLGCALSLARGWTLSLALACALFTLSFCKTEPKPKPEPKPEPPKKENVVDCNYYWKAKKVHVCIKDMAIPECEIIFKTPGFIPDNRCICQDPGKEFTKLNIYGYVQISCPD